MQISPSEYFPIVYQLPDLSDSGTYYVQAKIYKSDGTLIQTLNLVDKGSQRFSYLWQAPADTSGIGTHIYIVFAVYTDSGHTTLAGRYGAVSENHLIQDRINRGNLGGGGFSNINYPSLWRGIEKQMKELVAEEIARIKIEKFDYEKIDTGDKTNYEAIKSFVNEEISRIPKVKIPESITRKETQEMIEEVLDKKGFNKMHELTPKLYEAIDKRLDGISEKLSAKVIEENSLTRKWVKEHVEKYIDYLEKIMEEELGMRKLFKKISKEL